MEAASSSETSVTFAIDKAYLRRVEPIAILMRSYEGNNERCVAE